MTEDTNMFGIKLEADSAELAKGMEEVQADLLTREQARKVNRKAIRKYREGTALAEGLGVYYFRAANAKKKLKGKR